MTAQKTTHKQAKVVREKAIPADKLKTVTELRELMKGKKTILIASIKNLPASQFQEICKMLRGKAIVKVPKKSLALRAVDGIDKGAIKPLKEHIQEDIAILFSDLDAFELSSELVEKRKSAKAKAGQESPEDIVIDAGPTSLLPGPAISELGALGLKVAVEGGKISIKESKVLVKKGDIISSGAASLMTKLDIKPFKLGFEPLVAYDAQEEKLYVGIRIDKEEALKVLRESLSKALGFAVNLGYTNEDTIKFILAKAASHERALSALIKHEGNVEENKEEGK